MKIKTPKYCFQCGELLVWSNWLPTGHFNEYTGKRNEFKFLNCKNPEHDEYKKHTKTRSV